jgi:hypothetical protein
MEEQASNTENSLLGIMEFNEAKRLQALFKEKGIPLNLKNNPATCPTGGCRIQVEVHVQKQDIITILETLKQEHTKLLGSLNYDPSLLDEVFDPTAEKVRCPACGTDFSPSLQECPDCGLVFLLE